MSYYGHASAASPPAPAAPTGGKSITPTAGNIDQGMYAMLYSLWVDSEVCN